MTATKPTYRSGWCTTGAAAWSHAKCSGAYGHPPYEAVCACTCHDLAGVMLDAAFDRAKATVHDVIGGNQIRVGVWFRRQVGPDLLAKLHAIYPDLWDVAIPPVEVPR